MIVTYKGTDYEFDIDAIGVDEWRELKRKYKMTPGQFQAGLDEADPDAMTFAYLAMLRQNGRSDLTLGDHLKPDILAMNNAIGAAVEAEAAAQAAAEAEAEPDPTKASPSPETSPAPPFPTPVSAPPEVTPATA